jgi:GntR family transcriptional regulator
MISKIKKLIRLDSDSPIPIYAQIEEQMAQIIGAGVFNVGDRIPSVRELAAALRVNPLTVSKAYGRLADRSIVKTVRGKGVFVSEGRSTFSRADREKTLKSQIRILMIEGKRLGFTISEVTELVAKYVDDPLQCD